MTDKIVTCDLSAFGYCELELAIDLLKAYKDQRIDFLGDGLTLNFNTHSGNVFLSDEDYNVGMMNGDKLEQWFNCPYCGHEGFKDEMQHKPEDGECTRYLKEIGVIDEK